MAAEVGLTARRGARHGAEKQQLQVGQVDGERCAGRLGVPQDRVNTRAITDYMLITMITWCKITHHVQLIQNLATQLVRNALRFS